MYNPNRHNNPHYKMYFLHYIYVHLQPKCKYTTTKSKHFQPMKMNFELKNNTSTEINEEQAKVQLPPVWKIQKSLPKAGHQAATNEIGKTKPIISNNQDHPLLNYLSKSTPSKLRNNLMLFDPRLQMQKF